MPIPDLTKGGQQAGPAIPPGFDNPLSMNRKPINPLKYPCETCPSCGGKLWTAAFAIKNIPAVDLGEISNKDVHVPFEQVPVFVCAKCGEIAPFIKSDEKAMEMINKILSDPEPENQEPEPKEEAES